MKTLLFFILLSIFSISSSAFAKKNLWSAWHCPLNDNRNILCIHSVLPKDIQNMKVPGYGVVAKGQLVKVKVRCTYKKVKTTCFKEIYCKHADDEGVNVTWCSKRDFTRLPPLVGFGMGVCKLITKVIVGGIMNEELDSLRTDKEQESDEPCPKEE